MFALVCSLESPLAVFCLTETWVTNDDNLLLISIPRCSENFSNCRMGRGGRVTIQDRQALVVLKTLPSQLDESITVQPKYKNVCFQVPIAYNIPNGNE